MCNQVVFANRLRFIHAYYLVSNNITKTYNFVNHPCINQSKNINLILVLCQYIFKIVQDVDKLAWGNLITHIIVHKVKWPIVGDSTPQIILVDRHKSKATQHYSTAIKSPVMFSDNVRYQMTLIRVPQIPRQISIFVCKDSITLTYTPNTNI